MDYKQINEVLYRVEGRKIGQRYAGWIFFTRRGAAGQIEPERMPYELDARHGRLEDAVDDAQLVAEALIQSGIARTILGG
ncbi:hypothetical protein [Achromobacter denitrificans]|uniref:hypothetical protein n=1 Tax=Achromobacter denitrificans TaxID=32002 RepID=UPI000F673D7A|nr:hypothetical protein [Achromobacter denitrificans]RSE84327.1 hypothetical protein EGU64_14790 [Achromobacter denitrificans]